MSGLGMTQTERTVVYVYTLLATCCCILKLPGHDVRNYVSHSTGKLFKS